MSKKHGVRSGVARADPRIFRVARKVTRRLVSEGAAAVIMVGSRARGDSYAESDFDITAIGRRNLFYLDRVDCHLISIAWRTPNAARRELRNPSTAAGAVPAWRSALLLHDPEGIADTIRREARDWTWDVLGRRREAWIAEEFTGWAEEVHRLIGNLELGRPWAAAIQRSVLAIRLAPIMAVHLGILYDTENRLWDLVGARMGEAWTRAQSSALGIDGESLGESCEAALRLFTIAAEELRGSLDKRQKAVVEHACEIAKRAKTGDRS